MKTTKVVNEEAKSLWNEMTQFDESQIQGGLKSNLQEIEKEYGAVSMQATSDKLSQDQVEAWVIKF